MFDSTAGGLLNLFLRISNINKLYLSPRSNAFGNVSEMISII